MNWKYHIPHLWDAPRQIWEDVYLMPDADNLTGPSIWLTIDALGNADDPSEALLQLGSADYRISDTDMTDMIVRADDFDKEELLLWVKVWLKHNDFPIGELVEAPFAEFAGTNQHAETVAALRVTESA